MLFLSLRLYYRSEFILSWMLDLSLLRSKAVFRLSFSISIRRCYSSYIFWELIYWILFDDHPNAWTWLAVVFRVIFPSSQGIWRGWGWFFGRREGIVWCHCRFFRLIYVCVYVPCKLLQFRRIWDQCGQDELVGRLK